MIFFSKLDNLFGATLKLLTRSKKSLQEKYDQFSLYIYTIGVHLPGLTKAKTRLKPERLQAIERKILVKEIKKGKYVFNKYPLYIRIILEKTVVFYHDNRTFFSLFLKIVAGFLIIVLPISIFVLIRGILPVPDRIPVTEPNFTLSKIALTRTDSLLDPNLDKIYSSTSKLTQFKIENSPVRNHFLNGFIIDTNQPLSLKRARDLQIDIPTKNSIKFSLVQLPESDEINDCEIEIQNENSEVIFHTSMRKKIYGRFKNNSLNQTIEKRLNPGRIPTQNGVTDINIPIDILPESLVFTSKPLNSSKDEDSPRCRVGIANFIFERHLVKPLKQRGLILILVDGLNSQLSDNYETMPNLNNLSEQNVTKYAHHFASGNERAIATAGILTGIQYRSLDPDLHNYRQNKPPNLFNHKNIAVEARRAGYKTVAIGRIGDEELNIWDEAIEIKNQHYETRSITEETQNWLSSHGSTPFFIYLHYGTLAPPFRPPFTNLNLARFLRHPFGLPGEKELQRGVAKFFDNELGILLEKLNSIGLENSVSLALLGTHGTQMNPMNYHFVSKPRLVGATRSRSVLTVEELHVPFVLKDAKASSTSSEPKTILCPTSHLDVMPILLELLGMESKPVIYDCKNTLKILLADGEKTSNIILFNQISKKIDSFTLLFETFSQTIFSHTFPWRQKAQIEPQELYSSVSIADEKFKQKFAFKSVQDLNDLKKYFRQYTKLSKYLAFYTLKNENIDITFNYRRKPQTSNDIFSLPLPTGISYKLTENGENSSYQLLGKLTPDNYIVIPWQKGETTLTDISSTYKGNIWACNIPFNIHLNDLTKLVQSSQCLLQTPNPQDIMKVTNSTQGLIVKEFWGDAESTTYAFKTN